MYYYHFKGERVKGRGSDVYNMLREIDQALAGKNSFISSLQVATFIIYCKPLQTVLNRIRTNILSVLISVQTVWLFDSVPKRFFLKKLIFEKKR